MNVTQTRRTSMMRALERRTQEQPMPEKPVPLSDSFPPLLDAKPSTPLPPAPLLAEPRENCPTMDHTRVVLQGIDQDADRVLAELTELQCAIDRLKGGIERNRRLAKEAIVTHGRLASEALGFADRVVERMSAITHPAEVSQSNGSENKG